MNAPALLLALTLVGGHPSEASASTFQSHDCGVPRPEARRLVARLVSEPDQEQTRAKLRIPPARDVDIRALVGEKDAVTCTRLLAATLDRLAGHELRGLLPSYYQVGEYYYVALTKKAAPPGHVRTGFIPLYVVDRQFVVLRVLAL